MVCLALFFMAKANAQISANMQKAFQNSYAHETKKQYTEAISDIMPFYNENSYEGNLRIGWLYYLAKNYTSSQTYYARAVNIRPNAIEAKFGYIQPLSLLGSWDKVLAQYQGILKIDPQNTQANYWTGVILYIESNMPMPLNILIKLPFSTLLTMMVIICWLGPICYLEIKQRPKITLKGHS